MTYGDDPRDPPIHPDDEGAAQARTNGAGFDRSGLDRAVALEQSTQRIPGIGAGWARGNQRWIGCAGTVGGRADSAPIVADTQFRIGSITKTFVAVEILRLVAEGRVGLRDRIDRHLPDLGGAPGSVGPAPGFVGDGTVAELLTHTSGLPAETTAPWWERSEGKTWEELRGQLRLIEAQRGVFHYSNVGFALLGRIIEAHREKRWDEAIRTGILEPLGLTRTTYHQTGPAAQGWAVHPHADVLHPEPTHDAGVLAPAGQLWSTPGDLLGWGRFLLDGHPGVLDPDAHALLRTPRAAVEVAGGWVSARGLGVELWNHSGRRTIGHLGSMPGFLAALAADLDTGEIVVTLANTTAGISGLLPDAIRAAAPPAPIPAWTADEAALARLDLTGVWYWGPAEHVIEVCRTSPAAAGDGAEIELIPRGGRRGSRFVARGPDEFVGLDGYYRGETLRVIRSPDGAPHHLDLASFRITRAPYDPAADLPGGADRWR